MSIETILVLSILALASGAFGIALIASGIVERRKVSRPPSIPSGGPRNPGPILKP